MSLLTMVPFNAARLDFAHDSTVVICHAETPMLPLGQPEYPDQDKGVCDGIADY